MIFNGKRVILEIGIMKKQQNNKKKQGKMRFFGVTALVAFTAVLVLLALGMSTTINGIKEEAISRTPDAILAKAGLSEDKDVFLSAVYYDQKADECVNLYSAGNEALKARQFEWSSCNYFNKEVEKGLASFELSDEKIPVLRAGKLTPNRGLDNAERWFKPVEGKSSSFLGTLGLKYEAEGTEFYFYRDKFYPLDEIEFSKDDSVNKDGHNHLFTMSFAVPFTVLNNGSENFEITTDDDTFVYIDDKLVIDMGGIHGTLAGRFSIHEDGEVYAGVGDEDLAFTGVRLNQGEAGMMRIFHADRDSDESVFGVKFSGMNISFVDTSKLARENNGIQIAYDPTDPSYEAPLGQSVVVEPDNSRGLIIMATIEGVMVVVFAVLLAIAARMVVRRKIQ